MRYCVARRRERDVTMAYRNYLCDSIYAQARGEMLTSRFSDLLVRHEPIDAEAVVDHVTSLVSAVGGQE